MLTIHPLAIHPRRKVQRLTSVYMCGSLVGFPKQRNSVADSFAKAKPVSDLESHVECVMRHDYRQLVWPRYGVTAEALLLGL